MACNVWKFTLPLEAKVKMSNFIKTPSNCCELLFKYIVKSSANKNSLQQ